MIAERARGNTGVLKKNKWLGGPKIELGGPLWEGLRGAVKIHPKNWVKRDEFYRWYIIKLPSKGFHETKTSLRYTYIH